MWKYKDKFMIIIHQIEKLRKYVNKIKKERLAADLLQTCAPVVLHFKMSTSPALQGFSLLKVETCHDTRVSLVISILERTQLCRSTTNALTRA